MSPVETLGMNFVGIVINSGYLKQCLNRLQEIKQTWIFKN